MKKVALYGKGGIGKSTVSSNITAALGERGYKVMQIGCDPKADSTALLTHGRIRKTVLEQLRDGTDIKLGDIVAEGYSGCLCVECGGPAPGTGCAGRGIIAAFETLRRYDAIREYKPDVIIFDVLGDVVCGGFAMPIRNGYAKDVFIVTSGEMMSLYAAVNISSAVRNCSDIGYARLNGLIQNSKGICGEDDLVDRACLDIGTDVVARIPRSETVQQCESAGKTVVECAPDSSQAEAYRHLASEIMRRSSDVAYDSF